MKIMHEIQNGSRDSNKEPAAKRRRKSSTEADPNEAEVKDTEGIVMAKMSRVMEVLRKFTHSTTIKDPVS